MATVDYRVNQATAKRLLAKYGQDMQVVVYEKTTDPVAGTSTIDTTEVATVSGVDLPASQALKHQFQSAYTEDLVHTDVKYLLISADTLTFEVKAGALLYNDGKYFEVKGTTVLKPSTVTILYWLMVVPSTIDLPAPT